MSDEPTRNLDLGRETLISFSSNAAMMAFGFFGVVLFANVLGPAGLGAYYLVLAGGKILTQITGGISSAVKKRVSEIETDPQEYFGLGLGAHLLLTCFVLGAGIIARPILRRFIDVPYLIPSLVAVVFSFGLFQVYEAVYTGIGNPGYASWFDTARSILTLLFQVGFLIIGWGPFGLVMGFTVANVVTAIFIWIEIGTLPTIPSRDVISSVRAFAVWSTPTGIVTNLYGRLDVVLIGVFVSNAAVGYYEAALRLVQPAAFAASSIAGPLLVKSSILSSQGSDITSSLKNAIAYTPILAVPILFGALAIPRPLMRTVYGAEFGAAGTVLIGLAVFQLFNAIQSPFSSFFTGSDRIRSEFEVSIITFGLYLPTALLLGYQFGLMGVVVATVISEAVRTVAYLLLSKRVLGENVLERPLLDQFFSGIIMYLAVWAIVERFVDISNWFWLLVVVGFGALIYFGVLFLVSNHFRVALQNNIPYYDHFL